MNKDYQNYSDATRIETIYSAIRTSLALKYKVRQKSSTLKFFAVFLANV